MTSPDGKRIVSGSEDTTVRVWDAQTGQEVVSLKGHTDSVDRVCFSPDGKRIASGSWDGARVGREDHQATEKAMTPRRAEAAPAAVGSVEHSPQRGRRAPRTRKNVMVE